MANADRADFMAKEKSEMKRKRNVTEKNETVAGMIPDNSDEQEKMNKDTEDIKEWVELFKLAYDENDYGHVPVPVVHEPPPQISKEEDIAEWKRVIAICNEMKDTVELMEIDHAPSEEVQPVPISEVHLDGCNPILEEIEDCAMAEITGSVDDEVMEDQVVPDADMELSFWKSRKVDEEEGNGEYEAEDGEMRSRSRNKKAGNSVAQDKISEFLKGIQIKLQIRGLADSFNAEAALKHLQSHAAGTQTSVEAFTRRHITLHKAGKEIVDFFVETELLQKFNSDLEKVVEHLHGLTHIDFLDVFRNYYKMMLNRKSSRIYNQKAMVIGEDKTRIESLENSTIIGKLASLLLGLECLNIIGIEHTTCKSSIYHHVLGKKGRRVSKDRAGQKDAYILQKNGLSTKDIEWLLVNKTLVWDNDRDLQSVLVMIMMADMAIRPCTARTASKEIDESTMKPYMGLQFKNIKLIRCPNDKDDQPFLCRVRVEVSIFRNKKFAYTGVSLAEVKSTYPRRKPDNSDDTTINGAAAVLILAFLRKLVNMEVLSKEKIDKEMDLLRPDIDGDEPLILRAGTNGGNLVDLPASVPEATLLHGIKKLGLPTPYCFTARSLRIGYAERAIEELVESIADDKVLSKEAAVDYLVDTGAWDKADNAEVYLRNVLSQLPASNNDEWTALEWKHALYKCSARSRFSNGYQPVSLEDLDTKDENFPEEPKDQQILVNLTNWNNFNDTAPDSYEWMATPPLDFYSMAKKCSFARNHEGPFYLVMRFAHPDPTLPAKCPVMTCDFTAKTKKESDQHLDKNKGHSSSVHVCPADGSSFKSQHGLAVHCKTFHYAPAELMEKTAEIPFFDIIGYAHEDPESPTACPVEKCDFETIDPEEAQDHWNSHKGAIKFICPCNKDVTMGKRPLMTHVQTKHHFPPCFKTQMKFVYFDQVQE